MAEGPTLRQLRYFLRAVETGSFSAAADAEHVSQPSLSDQVRRMERNVGAQLFTRTTRGLQLTDVGRVVVPLAEQTLRCAEDLVSTTREARTLAGGEVSFGMSASAHRYLLAPLVSKFRASYPQVRVRIIGLNSAEVADHVRSGELEAGLVQLPVDEQQLSVSEPVLTDEVVYVSANPAHTVRPVTITELAKRTLILADAHWHFEDPLRRSLAARSAEAGVAIRPVIEVEFPGAALELAAAGVGDTLASYFGARLYERPGQLNYVSLDAPYPERHAFVSRAGGGLSPATRRFMAMTRRHLSSLQATMPSPSDWEDHRVAT